MDISCSELFSLWVPPGGALRPGQPVRDARANLTAYPVICGENKTRDLLALLRTNAIPSCPNLRSVAEARYRSCAVVACVPVGPLRDRVVAPSELRNEG